MGLKVRLILVLMIPLILVVGVYGFIRVGTGREELLSETTRNARLIARAIQLMMERGRHDRETSDLNAALNDIIADQDQIERIRILDRHHAVLAMSGEKTAIAHEVPTEVLRRVAESGRAEGFSAGHGSTQVVSYVVPLRVGEGDIAGTIDVSHQTSKIEERVRSATWDIAVRLTLLAVSITLLTGLVLQREVLRPLSRLVRGIRDVGRGESTTPLPIARRDEIGRVAEAFNAMTTQLQAARDQLLLETEHALELDQQLRQAATLAVAGRLATGLAHEIGTPLNIISAQVEYVQHLPPRVPLNEELAVIVEQIDRISGMIRSLLDTVRPLKPDIGPTALKGIVDRLFLLLEHTARRHGVALEVAVPNDLPLVRADRNQLQQVIINLLMNAFEAARPSGTVSLRARRAEHTERPGVEVEVQDTGPGVIPSLRSRIFEPFFSTKPPGEGTGLGLPICRDVVTSFGGELTLAAGSGPGATFVVWLAAEGGTET
jgi:signal transduction histidine kinase